MSSSNPGTSRIDLSAHLPALDGVRGLAILIVLVHGFSLLSEPQGSVANLFAFGLDRGWVGVQLFFVLSGFLITGILLDTRRASNYFSSFFGRRVLRIFPLYYGTLLLFFILLPALDIVRTSPREGVWLAAYLSDWVQPFGRYDITFPHFWSLAVEEQFYLVWPLVVYFSDAARLLKISMAVALVAFVIRWGMLRAGLPSEAVYEFSVCRMDALAFGAAASSMLRMPSISTRLIGRHDRLLFAAVGVLFVGAMFSVGYERSGFFQQTIGYSFLAGGFALFVLATACAEMNGNARWLSALRSQVLCRFGLYSYAMYVFHVPLRRWVGIPLVRAMGIEDRTSPMLSVIFIVLGIAASYGIAALSYRFFEIHFLRLKRRFEPVYSVPDAVPK